MLPDALDLIRYAQLIGAPAGIQPVVALKENGFNSADISLFDLKKLRDLKSGTSHSFTCFL